MFMFGHQCPNAPRFPPAQQPWFCPCPILSLVRREKEIVAFKGNNRRRHSNWKLLSQAWISAIETTANPETFPSIVATTGVSYYYFRSLKNWSWKHYCWTHRASCHCITEEYLMVHFTTSALEGDKTIHEHFHCTTESEKHWTLPSSISQPNKMKITQLMLICQAHSWGFPSAVPSWAH